MRGTISPTIKPARAPITGVRERLYGLTNSEANHGEDVKEYYFYLDSTPTHSYMKYLYKLVLAHRAPLALTEVWPPLPPGDLFLPRFVQTQLFRRLGWFGRRALGHDLLPLHAINCRP
jgi:hypothetical protein